jgi:amino acid adenylation domain-containing protein
MVTSVFQSSFDESYGRDSDALYPLSSNQQVIWLDQMLNLDAPFYNIGMALQIDGDLHLTMLERALTEVVRANDALRLVLCLEDGLPRQRLLPPFEVTLTVVDFSQHTPPQKAAWDYMQTTFRQPFDFSGVLWEWQLVRVSATRHYILQRYHHIVADAWCVSLISFLMGDAYNRLLRGEALQETAAPSYLDFIVEDQAYLGSERFERDKAFWSERYAQVPAGWVRPVRAPQAVLPSEEIQWSMPRTVFARISELAGERGFSVAHFMTALLGTLVARTSDLDEVIIGMPVHNRSTADKKRTCGMFASMLPIRVALDREATFVDLMQTVALELRQCYRHQRFPLAEINRPLNLWQNGRRQLFDIALSFESVPADAVLGDGIVPKVITLLNGFDQTPLTLFIRDYHKADAVLFDFTYNTGAFERAAVEKIRDRLLSLVVQLLRKIDTPVGQLSIINAAEREQVLYGFNASSVEYLDNCLIHELFENQVQRDPNALAVVSGTESLRYGELNRRANQLAHHLRTLGVGPDQPVALCLERGPEMIVGVLGILKAGGAYVPLDPAYPLERLAWMLADAAPRVLLTQARLRIVLPVTAANVVEIDADWPVILQQPDANPVLKLTHANLAYIIYTSGSTGQPKGVMVEHGQVANYIYSALEAYELTAGDRFLLFASISFDVAVEGIFGPLCAGATLVLRDEAALAGLPGLARVCAAQGITVLGLPTAWWHRLMGELDSGWGAWPSGVRLTIMGGEAASRQAYAVWKARLAAETRLINVYGPTEVTVAATRYSAEGAGADLLIGRPVANVQVYILDARRQPVPVGVAGEIYVGGAGVARGYLNRPELTAERFVPDPFFFGRMYKTGDLGCWRADGNIEYLGRNDFQVKVRGFRIELGEIEARLLAYPAVREAVVLVREDSPDEQTRRLVAYLTSDKPLRPEALRHHLRATLPDYMLPSAFVTLAALPLTPNGKVDRRALPEPDDCAVIHRHFEPPQGEMEETLAAIWAEVLKLERVGRHDSFFDLGGHSLLAVQVIEKLHQAGLAVEVRSLFGSPVLSDLARELTYGTGPGFVVTPNLIPPECKAITPEMLPLVALSAKEIETIVQTVPGGAANVQDIYPLAPLQEGILFHHLLNAQGDAYVLPVLFAFQARMYLDAFLEALRKVIGRHDVLRSAVLWNALPRALQVVYRHADLPVEEIVLQSDDPEAELKALMAPANLKMDLRRAPLLQVRIAADPASRKWYALLQVHHLTLDHVALEIVVSEIFACLRGEEHRLPAPIPYRGFVAQSLTQKSARHAEAFFRAKLGDVDEPTLPFGLSDTHAASCLDEASEVIDSGLARSLRQCARQLGVSAAALFHTAWALVIARTSGRDDVVFGSVLSGRLQGTAGADRIVGMFINTLPLRLKLAGQGAQACVRATQRELFDLLPYEQTPLALAQHASGVAGSLPLFSGLLNYRHSDEAGRTSTAAAYGVSIVGAQERTNYPCVLGVDDLGDGFVLNVQIDNGVAHNRVAAARVAAYTRTALEALTQALERAPERPILDLSILPAAARGELLYGFNATDAAYPDSLLHELFEQAVRRNPDAPAVEGGGQILSYGELNHRANQLAHHLRALGVVADQPVVLCVERSLAMIVGLMGILKAGGAYVPLDPGYPPERLDCMFTDAAPRVILTLTKLRAGLPATTAKIITLDADWPLIAQEPEEELPREALKLTPASLAYIIYTSGSTGQPKGVMVEHRQVTNYVHSIQQAYELTPHDRYLQFVSISFDGAVDGLFGMLCTGGTLVLRDEDAMQGLGGLARACNTHGVTIFFLSTAWWHLMMSELDSDLAVWPVGVRVAVIGGEAASRKAWEIWKGKAAGSTRLINIYGPTETTVSSTRDVADRTRDQLMLGKPVSNTQIYILDARGELVPPGVAGEIYIGGAGVARGYLNRPAQTAERFVADPFFPSPAPSGQPLPQAGEGSMGARMYKTGDQGRWLSDGCIEYLGRNDDQIKLRGFRIEPGEIEARLLQHPAVRGAVVLLREDDPGQKRLVAYLTTTDAVVQPEELRTHLRATLPDYMLPGAFVLLAALPLTPNGKVDRRALPAPLADAVVHRTYEPPQGEVEEKLAVIWAEVLKFDRVGRHDNFFDLGGHSLLAVQVVARVKETFAVDVPLAATFQAMTLAALAETISACLIKQYEAADIERIVAEIDLLSGEELQALLAQESKHE